MAKIPYYFDTPIPRYFRENGWLKNPKTRLFIQWCFERCSSDERIVVHDGQQIILKPYQFIFGRKICSEELGLTEDQVRTQQLTLEKPGFLRKSPNKTPNRFTIYEWSIELFLKVDPQQNPQETPNKPPTNPQQIPTIKEEENKRIKKDHHHPDPSSFHSEIPDPFASYSKNRDDEFDDLIDDDFSFSAKKQDREIKVVLPKIEIYPGIFLTQEELDLCIQARGSRSAVEQVVLQVHQWPGRKNKILDWVSTIKNWKFKNQSKDRIQAHEDIAKRLESLYGNPKLPWSCRIYHDNYKDVRGLLFENIYGMDPIVISFDDFDFQNKVTTIIKEKNMQKDSVHVA